MGGILAGWGRTGEVREVRGGCSAYLTTVPNLPNLLNLL